MIGILFAAASFIAVSSAEAQTINHAIQPYRLCLGNYTAARVGKVPDNVLVLGQQALVHCQKEREAAELTADEALVSSGVKNKKRRASLVSFTLCEVDERWDPGRFMRLNPIKPAKRSRTIQAVQAPPSSVCSRLLEI